ncbi:MAG TPA: ATP-binding protein [Azospirillum sp.]
MPPDPSRLDLALQSARLAFFSHEPDWRRDPRGMDGRLEWTGCRFGIRHDAAGGLNALLAAVVHSDRDSLLTVFGPNGGNARAGEFRVDGGQGRVVFLYCDASLELGADGLPRRVFGTLQDVTDRHRFDEALSETLRQKEMLLSVIDACPISITVADARAPDTPLIYANQTFGTLTGYDPAEVLGTNCRFLQGPATDPAAVDAIRDAVAAGTQAEIRLLNYRKDGTAFLNRLVLAPIRDGSGVVAAYLGLQSDVTDTARREESERQRQRVEALGRMMGGVAHEINNLLQPVALLTQELLDHHAADADGEYLDMVLDCTRKARRIIGDLLAFSRPSGRVSECVAAGQLLGDALALVRKAVGPGIDVTVAVRDGEIPVKADKTTFTQVVLNLAVNAAAAMGGAGTVAIALCGEPAGRGRRRVRIDVADSGCGMDRATLERAFEPFFTTNPVGQGTGLGLSVAYGLVKDMGGDITLESAPGRGTRVVVLLPEARGENGHGEHTRG